MAINFPNSPTDGSSDVSDGPWTYHAIGEWDGIS